MNFGERLSSLRTMKKLTQQELANRLNIAKSTLAMYETGKREPSFETTEKIADFFEVSVDYLLGRSESPDNQNKHLTSDSNNKEDENLFFFDIEGLSEEDIKEVKKHIEFLRFKAKEHNEKNK